ncbi:hypothetical protein LOAG_19166 [Loa loa]|uniref:Uncharacterized protein n=1 Tax=Loa loa TaxID=7209 RepID=A0A1S0UDA9_LOALO|nr:hypothetical protein LOAG_19166 [Loa loa]EJD73411.1 hypothetical protein LOAG_19166 [Loa loa]
MGRWSINSDNKSKQINIDELWDNGGWTIVYFGGETVSICGKLSGLDKVKSGKL